ncbi:hypothetical protein [Rhizobium sp. 2MFCol3.1]|uniref:slr1658 superfamily regulator n=1 Tax=Rhizobium sp. 2MFCol3.1 TaxID=1246459 RepID=UPI00036211AD|nr:hypothetical protein [Rhizobium sp. 2MFCol3.1]
MASKIYGSCDLVDVNFDGGARLTLIDGPLQLGWKHSGITSDFIAEVMAMPFASRKDSYNDVHHSISYLTNELIENAVKFRLPAEIKIEACLGDAEFLLRVRNPIDPETSSVFQRKLDQILDDNPGDLLIQQIEANALSDGSTSGLGLLTLLSDYGAKMTWEFCPHEMDSVMLTTTAAVAVPLTSNL